MLADPDHVEDAQATTAIHTAIALGVEKLDSTPLVPQSLALSVHRELAASGLDRLMIKIKTARRKLTFIRGEIKEWSQIFKGAQPMKDDRGLANTIETTLAEAMTGLPRGAGRMRLGLDAGLFA